MNEWLIRRFVKNHDDVGNPAVRTAYGKLASITGILCNALLSAAKAAIGLITGSISIVADAMNNLSDASSNIIALLGFKLASRPADDEHPYGHGRFEYLSGLAVAVMIVVIGIELLRSSIDKIANHASGNCSRFAQRRHRHRCSPHLRHHLRGNRFRP